MGFVFVPGEELPDSWVPGPELLSPFPSFRHDVLPPRALGSGAGRLWTESSRPPACVSFSCSEIVSVRLVVTQRESRGEPRPGQRWTQAVAPGSVRVPHDSPNTEVSVSQGSGGTSVECDGTASSVTAVRGAAWHVAGSEGPKPDKQMSLAWCRGHTLSRRWITALPLRSPRLA